MTAQAWTALALWIVTPCAVLMVIFEGINLVRGRQLRADLDEWGDWADQHVANLHDRAERTDQDVTALRRQLETLAPRVPTVVHAITDAPTVEQPDETPTDRIPAQRPTPYRRTDTNETQALLTVPAITEQTAPPPPDPAVEEWARQQIADMLARIADDDEPVKPAGGPQ